MTTCPSCKGNKGGEAFVCGPNVHGLRWTPCSTCNATGEITEEHLARIEYGRLMREDRIRRRLTVREEAKRLGVSSMAEWSGIENGREPETEEGRKALELRRGERLQPPPEEPKHAYRAPADWPGGLCLDCGRTKGAGVHG